MSISIINHQGRDIVFVDYQQCKSIEEAIETVAESEKFLLSYPGEALVLVDITGIIGSKEYMDRAKEMGKKVDHKVAKRAILGVTGLKMVLLQGYTRLTKSNTQPFSSRDEALDFLIS